MSVEDESWDRSICNYCKSYIQYGQKGLHLNGVCLIHNPINNIEMEDLPLITGKHRNKATKDLGKVYRVSTNPPDKYPEIGCVEVNNALSMLALAYAEIEFLKKKL